MGCDDLVAASSKVTDLPDCLAWRPDGGLRLGLGGGVFLSGDGGRIGVGLNLVDEDEEGWGVGLAAGAGTGVGGGVVFLEVGFC